MIRRALLAALAALLVGASPPASDGFAQRIAAAIRKADPAATVTVDDPRTLTVKRKGREDATISTDRIDQFCASSSAADCETERTTFVRNMVTVVIGNFDGVTREQLRVIVRGNDFVAGYVAYIGEGKRGALVTRPVAQGVSAVLAADFPTATRMVATGDLDPIGLTVETAMALGEKQTVSNLPPVPKLAELKGLIAVSGYDYGASLLLLPERWHDLADATHGTLFVAVPSDANVLIGTATKEELPKIQALVAEDYRTASRGVSPLIYRWSPSGWVVAE